MPLMSSDPTGQCKELHTFLLHSEYGPNNWEGFSGISSMPRIVLAIKCPEMLLWTFIKPTIMSRHPLP